jgi:hypothetical protein
MLATAHCLFHEFERYSLFLCLDVSVVLLLMKMRKYHMLILIVQEICTGLYYSQTELAGVIVQRYILL